MFNDISSAMKERMEYLEKADRKDREDGTPALQEAAAGPAGDRPVHRADAGCISRRHSH